LLEQFLKNCSLWEEPKLEKFVKDCITWAGPHTGGREKCEEKRVTEMKCYEVTTTPIPCPPMLLWVGKHEEENELSESEPVKKGGVRARCF